MAFDIASDSVVFGIMIKAKPKQSSFESILKESWTNLNEP